MIRRASTKWLVFYLAWGLVHAGLKRMEEPVAKPMRIGSLQGIEHRWALKKSLRLPNSDGTASCMKLSGFMPKETARALLATVQSSRSYDSEPDSVDHMPSFEFYPMIAGQWVDETMKHLLHEFAETVVLPYVRQTYSCPACAVADLLVRRYVVGERRTHQLHFDSHAYATVVLGLSDPSDFEGGLYIQPGTHASTRQFVDLGPGDLFVHSFDLQHGVRLWKGTRHSVVFWIKTCARSITEGTTPWYSKAAETGDPDALFNLGEQYLHGTAGMTMNPSRAAALYRQAAESGHHGAQTHLGLLLAETGGSGLRESAKWLKLSAKAGSVLGQKSLAFAYANGKGVEQNLTRASKWMMRAAEQDDLEAAYVLGTMYLHGHGLLDGTWEFSEIRG